jgi:hypothetical protein
MVRPRQPRRETKNNRRSRFHDCAFELSRQNYFCACDVTIDHDAAGGGGNHVDNVHDNHVHMRHGNRIDSTVVVPRTRAAGSS